MVPPPPIPTPWVCGSLGTDTVGIAEVGKGKVEDRMGWREAVWEHRWICRIIFLFIQGNFTVHPGYESGDTATLDAFNSLMGTHRALVDWVSDQEPWSQWIGQGLGSMPRGLRSFQEDRRR